MKINYDYLAGFTDGEGSIGIVGRGPRITWGQKDGLLLGTIRDFLEQEGYHPNFYVVHPKLPRRPNEIYMMNLSRRDEIVSLMDELEPRLIMKNKDCVSVRKWLDEHPSQANRSEVDVELLKTLAADGCTLKEIAKQMNCSQSKIYNASKINGVVFAKGGKVKDGKHIPAMSHEEYLAIRRVRERKNGSLRKEIDHDTDN